MKRIKRFIGKMIYSVARRMPESYQINFGQRKLRAFCGKLLLEKCGANVNIEKLRSLHMVWSSAIGPVWALTVAFPARCGLVMTS